MTPRDEITHHILRMTDAGLATRTPTSCECNPWKVMLDDQPAPFNARCALITLTCRDWATWCDCGDNIQLAILTPAGLTQLKTWDRELLNGTYPARSTCPLTGLTTAELATEARRLIDTLELTDPKDHP